MNPWGTMNDWQRFEVEERVRRYGARTRTARVAKARQLPTTNPAAVRPAATMAQDDFTACA